MQHERSDFAGPPAKGFYSREGFLITVPHHDKLAPCAPNVKAFSHGARRHGLASHRSASVMHESMACITLIAQPLNPGSSGSAPSIAPESAPKVRRTSRVVALTTGGVKAGASAFCSAASVALGVVSRPIRATMQLPKPMRRTVRSRSCYEIWKQQLAIEIILKNNLKL